MERLAPSCSNKATALLVVAVVPLLMALLLSAAVSADEELKKKAPGCHTVASCEPSWCDGQCRQWGYTDPVGAYCTYGGTLTRCCCGSIGAALSPSPATGVHHSQQQLVQ
ncbi:hypothetical protein E2562_001882 [Oryza meyeriana var. granulata]|uniref:Knottin scorpion toxin-like domain-containing protein n=1 Tax=Oryza meyeriana var. granulata TaxID=110450 RepID=A0A6G1C332_9ORYZ|nr:hypothetical protein E2562_001882 [Oryza meyeriana var. granulata]